LEPLKDKHRSTHTLRERIMGAAYTQIARVTTDIKTRLSEIKKSTKVANTLQTLHECIHRETHPAAGTHPDRAAHTHTHTHLKEREREKERERGQK